MTAKTSGEDAIAATALYRAAEVMSANGRHSSSRALLGQAIERDRSVEAAKPSHDRGVARKDQEYLRELLDLLIQESDDDVAPWIHNARDQFDRRSPYTAEELRHRLERLEIMVQSDRSGPLCYVLHMAPPESHSGYAVRTHHLVRAMQQCGLDPYCVTRLGFPEDQGFTSDAPFEDVDGIRYHRIVRPGAKKSRSMFYLREAAMELAKKLAPLNPRAIMAASNHENSAPALLAARYLGVPFIYDMRGFWELSVLSINPHEYGTPHFIATAGMEAEIAQQADLVFTLTEAMRDELRRRGVDNPNIHILPNAADPEAFRPIRRDEALAKKFGIPDGVPVIGYAGSFTLYEGLDDLVRACVTLHRKGHDFRVLLVGSEPSHLKDRICPELRAIAEAGGISDKLIMPGRVPVDEVEQSYSLMDIVPIARKDMAVTELVSPLKPLEAMAMEKAVVVTDLAALKEIVKDGDTGIVVPRSNPDALADAFARLLDDPDLRRDLGKRARQRVKESRNWNAVAQSFCDVLDRNFPK